MSEEAGPKGRDPPTETNQIDADALYDRIVAGEPVRLLDVRNRDEVDVWRIDGPRVTFTQQPISGALQAEVTETVDEFVGDIDGDGPITVVCAEGEASDYVAGVLAAAGYEAQNLAGGMEGWARVYRTTEIAPNPTVVQYHRPSSGCLGYLVVDGNEAAVVDPLRAFTDRYIEDAADRDATLVAVIDTHLHADHVSGLRALATAADAQAYMPAESVARGLEFDVETVTDGGEIVVGESTLRAVSLPGHTSGMTGFAVGETLLVGDSVFLDGIARPDLEVAGAAEQEALARDLHKTIVDRLDDFGDDTLIAPGHASTAAAGSGDLSARLGELRHRLTAFTLDRDAFVERVLREQPPPPANADRIIEINRGAETADAETAFELELGPNNCAASI